MVPDPRDEGGPDLALPSGDPLDGVRRRRDPPGRVRALRPLSGGDRRGLDPGPGRAVLPGDPPRTDPDRGAPRTHLALGPGRHDRGDPPGPLDPHGRDPSWARRTGDALAGGAGSAVTNPLRLRLVLGTIPRPSS